MRTTRSLITIFLFFSAIAAAEESQPTEGINVKLLAVEVAESSYTLNKNHANKVALINAYERYAEERCMGTLLRTLEYAGAPKDRECLEAIEKLLNWYPENPVALCIRDGIDSITCKDAYAKQTIEKGVYDDESRTFKKSSPSTMSKSSLDQKYNQLGYLKAQYQQTHNIALRDQILQIYHELLEEYCKKAEVEIDEPKETDAGKTELKRSRMISIECEYYTSTMLQFDSVHSLGICYREGFYTPHCIEAKRRERSFKTPVNPTKEKKQEEELAVF